MGFFVCERAAKKKIVRDTKSDGKKCTHEVEKRDTERAQEKRMERERDRQGIRVHRDRGRKGEKKLFDVKSREEEIPTKRKVVL